MTAFGPAVLRLTLAAVFVIHGAHMLFGLWSGPGVGAGGVEASAAQFEASGLSPGFVIAIVAGVIQLLGGVLLTLGWLTRWAAAALALYFGLVAWKRHLQWGFFLNWAGDPSRGQGLEFFIVLGGGLLCLILSGAGAWSVDGRRANRAASRAAGRARAMRRG